MFFHTAVYIAWNSLEQSWQEEEEANCHLATCVGRPPIPDPSRCTPTEALHSSYEHSPKVKKNHGKKVPDCPACSSFGATGKKTVILKCLQTPCQHGQSTVPVPEGAQFLQTRIMCVDILTLCEHHAFDMQLTGPGDNKTLLYTP